MRLIIKAHEGDNEKTVSLNVHGSDTVESVKSKLQELEGDVLVVPSHTGVLCCVFTGPRPKV